MSNVIQKSLNKTTKQITNWFANNRRKDNTITRKKMTAEEIYQSNKYPTKDERQKIAQTLNKISGINHTAGRFPLG